MLRILLFVEPKPLPQHLFFNDYWVKFPLTLCEQLHRDDAASFEFHIAVPQRFRHFVEPYQSIFGPRIYALDERRMVKTIHSHQRTIRDVWSSDFRENTRPSLTEALDNQVNESLPDVDWDLVLSFGEECRYSFARNCFCLNMETSPFSWFPFKYSFFMDHCGLFQHAAPKLFFGSGAEIQHHVEPSLVSANVRQVAQGILQERRSLHLEKRYDRHVLLPLQASNYSSFDGQCSYDSQIDYLFDVCNQFDRDTGIVVTEHPAVPSIDSKNAFGTVCRGLKAMFPNVAYLPRAKFFSSASLSLLADVDGIWSLASNVGPVASFLGKPLGTNPGTHIAYAADYDSPAQLESNLQTPIANKPVFDWMFDHYLVPAAKVQQPGWFSDYLKRRLAAYREHGTEIESFCATGLSEEDIVDVPQDSNQPYGSRCIKTRGYLDKTLDHFRNNQQWQLGLAVANGNEQTFVLINDTPKLETYRHVGCNHVMRTLQSGLSKLGMRQIGAVNSREDALPAEKPDWVVINGEGSFHHDSWRADEMLEIANEFRAAGAKVALINTIWESNRPELAKELKDFELVCVRDGRSLHVLQEQGIDAQLSPDLSLGQWRNDTDSQTTDDGDRRIVFCDNIIYERARKLFDACLYFDGDYLLLDHRQVLRLDLDGCFKASPVDRLTPNYLTQNNQLANSRMVITGRFHAAVGCVALKKPFLFVESNTNKISSLCDDTGLPTELMNVTTEIEQGNMAALENRIAQIEFEFPQLNEQLDQFYVRGLETIEGIFQQIKNHSSSAQNATFVDAVGLVENQNQVR